MGKMTNADRFVLIAVPIGTAVFLWFAVAMRDWVLGIGTIAWASYSILEWSRIRWGR